MDTGSSQAWPNVLTKEDIHESSQDRSKEVQPIKGIGAR